MVRPFRVYHRRTGNERHYAVIGRSEDQPILYHMNQSRADPNACASNARW
jgi:hypothetical protein